MPSSATDMTASEAARARKFRQAAFVYLHVAVLYEATGIAMWRADMLPASRMLGPGWFWLIAGAVVGAVVFIGLLRWQNVIFARIVWVFHGMRLPSLISYAFISTVEGAMTRAFYITAIVVVTLNLWMLARAAWDL